MTWSCHIDGGAVAKLSAIPDFSISTADGQLEDQSAFCSAPQASLFCFSGRWVRSPAASPVRDATDIWPEDVAASVACSPVELQPHLIG